MKRITGKERLLKMAHGGVSPEKAKEILRDGTANGKPLTTKQKGYFGAIAGGNARKKFAKGGKAGDPNKPIIPKSGRPTTQDSLDLYNNALAVLDYYNKRGYKASEGKVGDSDPIEQMDRVAKGYREQDPRFVPIKGGKSARMPLPKSQFRREKNANQFYQRESIHGVLDTRSPMQLFDRRIKPTKNTFYENVNPKDPLYADMVGVYAYDPNEIMPSFMRPKGSTPSRPTPSKFKRPVQPEKPKPPRDLKPSTVRGIAQSEKPNVQANVQPRTVSNKSKFSATYRDPNQPDKQREIYFPTKKAWKDFMGTGALRATDTSENAADTEAHATGYKTGLYAEGGEVEATNGGSGYAMAGQLLPQVGNLLQTLLDKPSYTNQPIMNAQTARNMTRPVGYAYGGELDDVDDEQYNNWLKGMFQNQSQAEGEEEEAGEEYGFDEGEAGEEQGRFGFEDDDEEEDEYAGTEDEDEIHGEKGDENAYAHGGIYIKPSKRGTFTAAANKHGKSVQTFAAQVMANKENYSPAMVKKANFARNAAKWKHANGGVAQGGKGKGWWDKMMDNLEVPEKKLMKALTGKEQKPSDWLKSKGWNNRVLGFVADQALDPVNYIPLAGPAAKVKKGVNAGSAARRLYNATVKGANAAGAYNDATKKAMGGGAAQVDQPVKFAQGGWIKGAINPSHKGYCTPMTKSTCTPRRKALAKRFKKGGDLHKKAFGGFSAADMDGRREVGMYAFGSQAEVEHANNLLANTPNPTVYAHGGMNNAGGNASELQLLLYANGGVFADEAQREVELQRGVYANGGWIKKAVNPAHKGYCTPMTKSTCTPRRKALAKTFKKHHGFHANGGQAEIEVEGNEILEAPNGEMIQPQGPTHEQGGIPMSVPEGTKIYSDRLGLEGKTMQQRKKHRENTLKRMEKLMDRNPTDVFLKNSYERTKDIAETEDAQDVALMKVANDIYAPPERAWRQGGGKEQPAVTAAYGDVAQGDPWSDYLNSLMGSQQGAKVPFLPGTTPEDMSQLPSRGSALSKSARGVPQVDAPINVRTAEDIGLQTPSAASRYQTPSIPGDEGDGNAAGFTAGDYIGMGGNLFNAIAPIINTRNAARATKPERNRFKGFGREALEANQQAQTYAGKGQANARRNQSALFNSSAIRNRMGARDINTMRALDTVADMNRNKAVGDIDMSYTNQMAGLLAQQGQLANTRDQVVMSGEQARDEREAQNTDNYYSNMAENLTNFGNNIQGLGRNLNTSQGNRDNTALLEQMSEYFDFGRNKNGKLVLRNKRKKS